MLLATLLGLAPACRGGSDVAGDGGALVCTVEAPTACPDPAPTFADVQPIIQSRCTPCHNGVDPDGPWPLVTYRHVADWADVVRDEVLTCAMPPEDGGIPMTDEDRTAILTWIRCGYPP
jgi:uncharacterized membrane protein